MELRIEWNHGTMGSEADEERAIEAAERVLTAAGVNFAEAEAEFERQEDDGEFSGLGLVWQKADYAAFKALTEGWHNPDDALYTLRAA
jgi:hypothetical protein